MEQLFNFANSSVADIQSEQTNPVQRDRIIKSIIRQEE